MRTKRLIRASITTIIFLVVSGCVASHPKDLKYSSLSIVSRFEGDRFIAGISKPTLNKKFLYLQLDMTTKENILALAVDENYLIAIDSFFCNQPKLSALIDSGALYWEGEDINIKANKIREKLGYQKSGLPKISEELFTYSVFLGINSPAHKSWKKNSDGSYKDEYEAYDLVMKPENICVAIVASTMINRYSSNIIKVDKKMIQKELKIIQEP